jgi:hypothetical protein
MGREFSPHDIEEMIIFPACRNHNLSSPSPPACPKSTKTLTELRVIGCRDRDLPGLIAIGEFEGADNEWIMSKQPRSLLQEIHHQ